MKRELSVRQLAELCAKNGAPQLTEASLGNIERGQDPNARRKPRDVSVDELLVLAYVLDARPAELMFGWNRTVEVAPNVPVHPYVAWGWLLGIIPTSDIWGPLVKDRDQFMPPHYWYGWSGLDHAHFQAVTAHNALLYAKEHGVDVDAAQDYYHQCLNRLGIFLADMVRGKDGDSLPPLPSWLVGDLRAYDAQHRVRMKNGFDGRPHPETSPDGFIYMSLPGNIPVIEEARPL
jgi:hypothetical protein